MPMAIHYLKLDCAVAVRREVSADVLPAIASACRYRKVGIRWRRRVASKAQCRARNRAILHFGKGSDAIEWTARPPSYCAVRIVKALACDKHLCHYLAS